ncbi:AAA family ATPase [Nostoc sp.]|uniref:trifunctional serine/threonine-protein kinase/ATP-binding protein/sensor histidine kinase n=1 Tax=Nostoc sp. TaxID=1180 RepID=UPI003FA607EE
MLDILYRERIIHKDIKPANILINPETKQVKLIDFSIASLLPRETQTLINPNVLEGTLAYISPEQTGRMNRGIDYRTDFYSVGVTFYELLTGKLPFASNDPMELVHCHIAKMPMALENREEIPQVLCDIVMKLMAKNAEDRYQSALGLKFDLENCLHQLQVDGIIKGFEIASRDVCDRFIIPDKLYGRETEVETLLQAFERVCLGATEMMLVAGFSGIGKTAVVNEVHKPIVRQRGYFIKGKFDQFQRNIPFSAFVQAFRDLMEQLLTESDVQIQQWKNQILSAVGENGQVIIEVIPELSRIIGEQPPAIELSGTSAQNRFNSLFQKFTQVFTSAEHPLVMFLDDLQWADSASLKLMQLLMADTGYLFIIGAYRDNEVHPGHPLMLTLNEIQKNQATINTITLAPLSQEKVNQLVADTLKCPEDLAWTLSQLLYQKTQGNPFFATQFLKALHQEELIKFDFESGFWQCDIAQVMTQSVTDDVVAFMSFQLQKLPPSTQQVLQLAACIGNQFDLATLAIVSEQSQIETAADLWKALQEGLILPISDVYKFYQDETANRNQQIAISNEQLGSYKFLHDRVQQAAYSLIPEAQKGITHLCIGQLLLDSTPIEEREEKIFEIVSQLNQGSHLVNGESQREELTQLNLMAAQKAQGSTAYAAANEYLAKALDLLSSDCWQNQYLLAQAIYKAGAEVNYLSGDYEKANELIDRAMQKIDRLLEKIPLYKVRIQILIARNQLAEVINLTLNVLQELGVFFPEEITSDDTQQAMEKTKSRIFAHSMEELLNLPEMSDPLSIAIIELSMLIVPTAYFTNIRLLVLILAQNVELSIQKGCFSWSPYAYASFGMILVDAGGIEEGYLIGQLALYLVYQFDYKTVKSRVLQIFNGHIHFWKEHLQATVPALLEGYQVAVETGDLEYVCYSALIYCYHSYFLGNPLSEVAEEMKKYELAMQKLGQNKALCCHQVYSQSVLNLLGRVDNPCLLIGEVFDEEQTVEFLRSNQDFHSLGMFYVNKLNLCYLFESYGLALEAGKQGANYLENISGTSTIAIYYLYDSLVKLAVCPELAISNPTGYSEYLANVEANQAKMQNWATYAPMNFQHKYDLVEAERHRVLNQRAAAADLYDRAITLAKEHQFINEEALANEMAAKFYLEWGKERIAQEYMTEAYYGYTRWGAKAKVADLEIRYPQLLAPILQQNRSLLSTNETIFALESITSTSSATSNSSSVSVALDLNAILKASQTISGEIELEKLLSSLLEIIIENAGANKCVLMMLRDDRLLIKGSIIEGSEPVVLQSLPIEDSQDIPLKLIYKVKHNRQTTVLIDATADPILVNDPYIMRQQPKSILCSPILHQGKLLGILYLENNLVTGAFTSDRVELLNLLCAQAAISLENARLYSLSLENAQQLKQSLGELSQSNSRFEKLVDNVPGVVYQYCISADAAISLAYISAECYDLYEITPDQAMSNWQLLIEAIHPDDTASYQQSITDSMQTLTPFNWSGRIITPSGIVKWIHGEARVEQLADGSLVWDGLILDISERKRAEQELQNAQLQIVQSEKMSALGNLVAGVAHEMNNPLGFIAASLKLAKPTLADIVEHLKLYQENLPNPADKIIDHAEEIDLDYSLSDLPKMLDSMSMACDRLKNISTSLRTFSRADQDYKVPFNIHDGIDSTILILKHRLKANEQRPAIEVVTNYGNLPQIECFPGQLNQVFMNLIANAIDALEESNHGRRFEEIKANPNCITITTSVENNLVRIAIADNGKGMSEQVKSKIFDHLFTTKAVGKGTGLGLAIARQIVEEIHGGKLSFNSVLGLGTEFIIEISV